MTLNKNHIIYLSIAISVILIILLIFHLKNKPIRVETDKVKRGKITSFISATGNVRPVTEIQVSSDVSGRVVSLPVKEGQMVTKGQLLAQIDSSSYRAQVNQSQANMEIASASLIQSKAQWHRVQELYKSRLISTQEMENTRSQYQQNLARTKQAKAELDQAIDNLNKTTINAPINGTITRLDIELGEIAVTGTMNFAGTVLMIIADLSKMRVECDVDEADIITVHTGEKAKITIDALPDTFFNGTVSEIANAQSTKNLYNSAQSLEGSNVAGSNPTVSYTVKIEFNDYKGNLKPDMTVNAEIITAEKENALIIPVQAVIPQSISLNDSSSNQDSSGVKRTSYAVFTVDKNRTSFQFVTTGIFGEDDVEITKGLYEGQIIITGPFSTLHLLKNNMRVQIIKPSKDSLHFP